MIVYTGGTFDLFHTGHVELLEYCKKLAGVDRVVVGLNTDDFINEYKGKPPVMSYKERRDVLLATRYVDEVIPNRGGPDSKPAITESLAKTVVIGMDWLEKDYCKQMMFDTDWLNANNIALFYAPRTRGVSTSHIKERI